MHVPIINGIDGCVDRLETLLTSTHGRRADVIFVLGNLVSAAARQRAYAQREQGRPIAADLKAEVAQELKTDQAVYGRIVQLLGRSGVPTFIIPGEHDAPLTALQQSLASYRDTDHVHLVHRQAALLDAQTVVAGFGGRLEGTTHPDPYLLHFPDWEARVAFEHLKTFVPLFNLAERRIFLFGTPLRGRHIDVEAGRHTGVEALNLVSRAYQPHLICCAGPARSRGIETIDGAVVVNPGSLAKGSYGWLSLNDSHVAAELHWLHTPANLRTLVVAIDGSEEAWTALDLVPALAQNNKTRVVLVHAFERVGNSLGGSRYDSVVAERVEHGEHVLKQAADALKEFAPRCELVEGPPAEAIVRVAEQSKADLVLMGSRGLGRIRGLLGSVSQAVLRHAPCPVLVAPGVVHEQGDISIPEHLEAEYSE